MEYVLHTTLSTDLQLKTSRVRLYKTRVLVASFARHRPPLQYLDTINGRGPTALGGLLLLFPVVGRCRRHRGFPERRGRDRFGPDWDTGRPTGSGTLRDGAATRRRLAAGSHILGQHHGRGRGRTTATARRLFGDGAALLNDRGPGPFQQLADYFGRARHRPRPLSLQRARRHCQHVRQQRRHHRTVRDARRWITRGENARDFCAPKRKRIGDKTRFRARTRTLTRQRSRCD